jgi:hypothetical protein
MHTTTRMRVMLVRTMLVRMTWMAHLPKLKTRWSHKQNGEGGAEAEEGCEDEQRKFLHTGMSPQFLMAYPTVNIFQSGKLPRTETRRMPRKKPP